MKNVTRLRTLAILMAFLAAGAALVVAGSAIGNDLTTLRDHRDSSWSSSLSGEVNREVSGGSAISVQGEELGADAASQDPDSDIWDLSDDFGNATRSSSTATATPPANLPDRSTTRGDGGYIDDLLWLMGWVK